MQLVCPHCHNPMEQPQNGALQEIVCPTCGSTFRLEGERTRTYADKHRQLGKFELLERVGVGAFGVVWKARDTDLNRLVAMKIPHAGRFVTPQDDARFLREGRSAAQLRHPGIVSVHEVGRHEGLPFLVADFIHGVTLADFLTSRRPSIREAAELMAQIAEALDYAHSMGVVHRDIKPSNIMLERPPFPEASRTASAGEPGAVSPRSNLGQAGLGKPMLMDFGLALRDEVEVTMTLDGQILGTPAYMSPEQAAGFSHQLDARSDIYSLGVVFYQLLTGELPFRGNSRMQMEQVLREEPRPPRRLNDKIPRDLDTICMKAMAKEPGRRYASARALADDLRRWLQGEPIQARPMGLWERGVNWAKRRPAVVALLAVSFLAALALVGLAVGSVYHAQLQTSYDQTGRALEAKEEQRQRAETALYFNRIVLAEREWSTNNVPRAIELLDDCPSSRRGWEWNYLKRLTRSELLTIRGHSNHVQDVAYSHDGERLISGSLDNTVRIWNAFTGQELLRIDAGAPVQTVAFSPDGKYVAAGKNDPDFEKILTVMIWDAATGKEIASLLGHRGPVYRVVFSRDGRQLVSTGDDKTVRIWDVTTGNEVKSFNNQSEPVNCAALSPSGRQLALACGTQSLNAAKREPGQIKIWNLDSSQATMNLSGHDGPVIYVVYSPDGKQIASASFDRSVRLWDVATGKQTQVLRGHTNVVDAVQFSPDGELIASCSEDGVIRIWEARTGKPLRVLRGHTGPVGAVAFTPSGNRLASAGNDGTVKIWDPTTDPNERTFHAGSILIPSVAYHSRGQLLATANVDRTIKIWHVETGQEQAVLPGHEGRVWRVVFSPDGRLLASASEDKTAKIWDVATAKIVRTLQGHGKWVQDVAFSPDGTRLATASGDLTVKIWDADSGRELLTLPGHTGRVWSVAFSPDGRRLASGAGDKTVRIWDLAVGKEIDVLSAHTDEVTRVQFSPDGGLLASAGYDQTIKIWDATTSKLLLTLRGHTHFVYGVAFSPDANRLASASLDGTVKVWDTVTGQEFLTLRGDTGGFYGLAISPNGRHIAASGFDGTVKIWNATPLEEATEAATAAANK